MNKNFLSTPLRPEWRRKASPGRAGTVVVILILPMVFWSCESLNPWGDSTKPCTVSGMEYFEDLQMRFYFLDSATGIPLVGTVWQNRYKFQLGDVKFWIGSIDIKNKIVRFHNEPTGSLDGHNFKQELGVEYYYNWSELTPAVPPGWPAHGSIPNAIFAYQFPGMEKPDTLSVDHYECGEAQKGYVRFYINRRLVLETGLKSPAGPADKFPELPIYLNL